MQCRRRTIAIPARMVGDGRQVRVLGATAPPCSDHWNWLTPPGDQDQWNVAGVAVNIGLKLTP